jgi:hypothetical protein
MVMLHTEMKHNIKIKYICHAPVFLRNGLLIMKYSIDEIINSKYSLNADNIFDRMSNNLDDKLWHSLFCNVIKKISKIKSQEIKNSDVINAILASDEYKKIKRL